MLMCYMLSSRARYSSLVPSCSPLVFCVLHWALMTPVLRPRMNCATVVWPASSKFIAKISRDTATPIYPLRLGARSDLDSAAAEGCGGPSSFGSHVDPPAPQQNHQTKDSTARQRNTACASAYIPGQTPPELDSVIRSVVDCSDGPGFMSNAKYSLGPLLSKSHVLIPEGDNHCGKSISGRKFPVSVSSFPVSALPTPMEAPGPQSHSCRLTSRVLLGAPVPESLPH
ncbi:hypothetical protein DFH08DRAFT_1002966 [Mycena albidolilacea]|uniref:Uncharacterized protein n=1 Tax=Mycena albidolilacea TaxID=1033008 RepID=A0AAD7AR56_9AGAR|nr:hypothetical protein DFH08DRAFT_1002966 [Mycena albidolilacea]